MTLRHMITRRNSALRIRASTQIASRDQRQRVGVDERFAARCRSRPAARDMGQRCGGPIEEIRTGDIIQFSPNKRHCFVLFVAGGYVNPNDYSSPS